MSISPEAELLTLDELAVKHGQIAPDAPDSCPASKYKWEHRVAALVHGWTHHDYHYAQAPVRLSDADYLAALSAARAGIEAHAAAVPSPPDLTEHADTLPPPTEQPAEAGENEHAQ